MDGVPDLLVEESFAQVGIVDQIIGTRVDCLGGCCCVVGGVVSNACTKPLMLFMDV